MMSMLKEEYNKKMLDILNYEESFEKANNDATKILQ